MKVILERDRKVYKNHVLFLMNDSRQNCPAALSFVSRTTQKFNVTDSVKNSPTSGLSESVTNEDTRLNVLFNLQEELKYQCQTVSKQL